MASTIRDLLLDLNKVRYSSSDFHTITDDIYARMQVKFAADFNDFQLSSLAIMFLDLVAFGLDTLSFYLDRRASDNYLYTARTRKSVALLARQLGYKITGAVSSSVDLTVSLKNAQVFPVTIPIGFQFKTTDGIIFETAQSTTFAIGDDSEDSQIIPCYQGTTASETFTSNGLANQVFELTRVPDDQFIASGSVSVLVNGSPYSESEFINFDETDQYEISYSELPPTIRFGDGLAGTIPPTNATIQVTYVITNGKSGLVPAESITKVVSNLVVGTSVINLNITNLEASVGGDDTESIDHIKSFAGKVFKARDVAITENDYEALAGSYKDAVFGTVAIAKAISSKSSATDLELQNLINTISTAVQNPIPDITSTITLIREDFDSITSSLETIDTTNIDMDAKLLSLDSNLQAILSSARDSKNVAQEMAVDISEITTDVSSLLTTVTAISEGGSDTLTSVTKNAILALLARVSGNATSITSESTSLSNSITSEILTINTSRDLVVDLQTDRTIIDTELTNITDIVGVSTAPETGLYEATTSILTILEDETTVVDAALSGISEHVDKFLAADCEANLVTVPILSFNNEGFYQAPSIGLIRSLQDFLDVRKEVTQIVKVTSGELFLIPAVISVRIGALPGFSQSVISATASSLLDGVLRNRKFGESLYVSDIVCLIKDIPGVSFDNITIEGHLDEGNTVTDKIDASGNLIILDTEVITKGSISITMETV